MLYILVTIKHENNLTGEEKKNQDGCLSLLPEHEQIMFAFVFISTWVHSYVHVPGFIMPCGTAT